MRWQNRTLIVWSLVPCSRHERIPALEGNRRSDRSVSHAVCWPGMGQGWLDQAIELHVLLIHLDSYWMTRQIRMIGKGCHTTRVWSRLMTPVRKGSSTGGCARTWCLICQHDSLGIGWWSLLKERLSSLILTGRRYTMMLVVCLGLLRTCWWWKRLGEHTSTTKCQTTSKGTLGRLHTMRWRVISHPILLLCQLPGSSLKSNRPKDMEFSSWKFLARVVACVSKAVNSPKKVSGSLSK